MKHLFVILNVLVGSAAFADPGSDCFTRISQNTNAENTAVACMGTSSDDATRGVVECFKVVSQNTDGKTAAMVCSGVKSSDDAKNVISCFGNVNKKTTALNAAVTCTRNQELALKHAKICK